MPALAATPVFPGNQPGFRWLMWAFAVCAAFALAAALASLLVRETRGKNVHVRLVGAADGPSLGAEHPA